MEFEIEEGKVVYKGEQKNKQSAIMLKLDGVRLAHLTQILIDSGWYCPSNVKESVKPTYHRNALILLTYKLLDWAIDSHIV